MERKVRVNKENEELYEVGEVRKWEVGKIRENDGW